MTYLVDTHILIWLSMVSARLNEFTRSILRDPDNTIYFSAISIFEVAVKQQLKKHDFDVDPGQLRRELIDRGYMELAVNGQHGVLVATLPAIHKDPFDRLLVAQATIEGFTLLTADAEIARYPGPILKV